MKSTEEQFCAVVIYCMDHYSKESIHLLGEVMNTHENVIALYSLIQQGLSENEFIAEMKKLDTVGINNE